MTETKNNFIAGEWLAGDTSIENRNPSDLSDIIGHFTQASRTRLNKRNAAWGRKSGRRRAGRAKRLMNIGNELIERSGAWYIAEP